jgi:peptidoglycan/xylan/chitin deacetylase (PgdA/CDA1 family)
MIFAMHGVAETPRYDRITDCNLTGRRAFEQFLSGRAAPFVALEEALRDAGDALTIDDATRAAADAAQLALARGHAVTLFVNPYNVERRTPHFFTLLDAAVDASRARQAEWDGAAFDLRGREGKWAYRLRIKQELRSVRTERARRSIVDRAARELGCAAPVCPRYLATLSKGDLLALQRAGASIENHGWTHAEPAALPAEELCREVERGSEWLREHLGAPATVYAAPFGDFFSRSVVARTGVRGWLLLSAERPAGAITKRVFNRAPAP